MRWSRLAIQLMPFFVLLMIIAACQGPPPTQYVIITDTPQGDMPTTMPTQTPFIIVVTATSDSVPPETTPDLSTPTNTVPNMPTPTFIQIQVAEQPFENGRMFWLEPVDQIWVMVEDENDKRSGVWMIFEDEFEEGDEEFDPSLIVPEGFLQPERGFGKLWRDNPEIREMLGWAKQPEIGHVSNYEYQPDGEIVDGVYEAAPSYHLLTSGFGKRSYRFNEINGTWQTIRNQDG